MDAAAAARAETEETPAMEVHAGEIRTVAGGRVRHCIIWLNGKRWEGDLAFVNEGNG